MKWYYDSMKKYVPKHIDGLSKMIKILRKVNVQLYNHSSDIDNFETDHLKYSKMKIFIGHLNLQCIVNSTMMRLHLVI